MPAPSPALVSDCSLGKGLLAQSAILMGSVSIEQVVTVLDATASRPGF